MRYLKLYEEYNNQYYREVDYDEFRSYTFPGMPTYKDHYRYLVNFDPEKLEILLNLLKNNGWKRDDDSKTNTPHYSFGRSDMHFDSRNVVCRFLQLNPLPTMFRNYPIDISEQPDEWYAVDMEKFNGKYYICDQFEGLLELLKDVKYGINNQLSIIK